jgi:hypothetical protein
MVAGVGQGISVEAFRYGCITAYQMNPYVAMQAGKWSYLIENYWPVIIYSFIFSYLGLKFINAVFKMFWQSWDQWQRAKELPGVYK